MRVGTTALLLAALLAAAACGPVPAAAAVSGGRRLVDVATAPVKPAEQPAEASNPAHATLTVDLGGWSKPVAPSFLGVSHEWVGVHELADPGMLQLLQDLAAYDTGPLSLRVGGGSTDLLRSVPDKRVWETLRRVSSELGAKLILGINFEAGDWNLTKAQFDAVRRELPHEAIDSVELGNEPNFYPNKFGKSAADYINCCYVNDWNRMVVNLSCSKGDGGTVCWDYQFAGPAWGHVHMAPQTLDWFLTPNHRWVNTVTVHWYKDRSERFNTASTLLEEPRMRRDAASLARLVETAAKYSKGLRLAEMNSISNNGRRGVSDTMGGALWSLDAALEVAATGATGVNFHWGDGANVYSAVIRRTRDGKPPIVKPAFYAYLLAQMALSGGVRIFADARLEASPAPGGAPANVKAWPLVAARSGALRVVLINKEKATPVVLTVRANRRDYGAGKLVRLTAPAGLAATGGARLGGVAYREEGSDMLGSARTERIDVALDSGGNSVLSVFMPPGSAALLTIPPRRK